jgi:hypothetical protein
MHGIFISALCVAMFMGIRSAPAEVMVEYDCGSAKVQYTPSEDKLYPPQGQNFDVEFVKPRQTPRRLVIEWDFKTLTLTLNGKRCKSL